MIASNTTSRQRTPHAAETQHAPMLPLDQAAAETSAWFLSVPTRHRARSGFSLLEMIIATAILAASGLVLSSLLGLGARFGNRAEERTLAIEQAHSLLAQFLAQPTVGETADEMTGELPGFPAMSFRLKVEEFTPAENAGGSLSKLLKRVSVEIFAGKGSQNVEPEQAICRVSQLVRAGRLVESSDETGSEAAVGIGGFEGGP